MFKSWQQKKDDKTPHRAILEFIDKATPKESPAIEDTVQTNKEPLLSQDSTPKIGTQSSQRSATKRKLHDELSDSETLKQKLAREMDQSETDSMLEVSDIPSHMDSPIINLPKRPNLDNRKRVSSSAFKHIIEKNKIHEQVPAPELSNLSDTSIMSSLCSPNINLPIQPGSKLKKRVSIAAFRNAIEHNKNLRDKTTGNAPNIENEDSFQEESSGQVDSSLSSLNIQETSPLQQANLQSKEEASTSASKHVIEEFESPEANSIEEVVEQSSSSVTSIIYSTIKSTEMVSLNQPIQSKIASISPLENSLNMDISQKLRSRSRVLSPSFEYDDQQKTLIGKNDSDSLSVSNDPTNLDLLGADPLRLSTSQVKGQASSTPSIPIDEKSRVLETQPSNHEPASPNQNLSSFMDSSVPSSLHSPSMVNFIQRPCPKSKKRVSVTAFKEVLAKRQRAGAAAKEIIQNFLHSETKTSTTSLQNQPSTTLTDSQEMDNECSPSELPESEIGRPKTALPEDFFPVASSTQMVDPRILSEQEMTPIRSSFSKTSLEVSESVNLSVSDAVFDMQNVDQNLAVHRPFSQGTLKKRVSMTEFLTALSKRHILNKDPSDSPEKEENANVTFTVSEKLSFIQNTSTDGITALTRSAPIDLDIIPTTDDEDTGLQLVETNYHNLDQPKSDAMGMESFSTLSPPEFSGSSSSGDAELTATSASTSEKNRSRKSLNFDSPSPIEISKLIRSLDESKDGFSVKKLPPDDEDNLDSGPKNDVPSASLKSVETPALGYDPSMKNSTVVAGGMSFYGQTLSLSPIGNDVKNVPATVQATPLQPARKRTVSQSPMYMSVMQKSLALKTKQDQSKQSTPKPTAAGKETRELIPVSKAKSFKEIPLPTENPKSVPHPEPSDREWEDVEDNFDGVSMQPSTSSEKNNKKNKSLKVAELSRAKKSFTFKGSSSSNPAKGKSLATFEGDEIPLAIRIAQEPIVDRSRNYVPLEQRLRADPIFQEKVRSQREKIIAEGATRDSVTARNTSTRKRPLKKKGIEDNAASAPINKANIRFYSQPMKVSKDALDVVHTVVGNWLEFTLDQMEIFCANESKESLETWEDCYAMAKSQGIVKNYWEYSGLCHELLMQDECASLLPSSFPPGHYESKRAASRE